MSIVDIFRKYEKFIYFGLVGGFGTILNTAILYLFATIVGMNYLIASMIATEAAIIFNFIGNNYFTFKGKSEEKSIARKFISFQTISLIALFGTVFFLWLFVTLFGKNLLILWNVLAILIMFIVNYVLNVSFTWNTKSDKDRKKKPALTKGLLVVLLALFLIFAYDVHAKENGGSNNKNDNANDKNGNKIGDDKIASGSDQQAMADVIDVVVDVSNNVDVPLLPMADNISDSNILQDQTDNVTSSDNSTSSDINSSSNSAQTSDNQTDTITNQTFEVDPILNDTNINQNMTPIINQSEPVRSNTSPTNNTANNTSLPDNVTNQTSNTSNSNLPISNTTSNNSQNQSLTNVSTNNTNNTLNNTNTTPPLNITNQTVVFNNSNTTQNNQTNITQNNTANNTQNNTQPDVIDANVIKEGTNLKLISTINSTKKYYMTEDTTARFYVFSDAPTSVTWYIDGVPQTITTDQNATFTWKPGVLYMPKAPTYEKIATSTIKAVTSTATVTWVVDVEDVINPFFSSASDEADVSGTIDTKIRIYTNNRIVNFAQLNATIISSSGSQTYSLIKQHSGSDETYWSIYIPETSQGNNYLTTITGFDNKTGVISTYDVGNSRGHYRNESVRTESSRSRSPGSSSRTSSVPELIYITFEKDVLGVNETQTITLDASYFRGGIDDVTVVLKTPENTLREIAMRRISGTKEYGTWSNSFGDFVAGQYEIISVILKPQRLDPLEVPVENRTFYYADNALINNANLSLVYSALDQSIVKNGTIVTLTLDAADSQGITAVNAYVNKIVGKNQSMTYEYMIPLSLIQGNKDYGTWSGTFVATTPDSTYSVTRIELINSHGNKTYDIIDRKVYVEAIPTLGLVSGDPSLNGITGLMTSPLSKENLRMLLKSPFATTVIGFFLMAIIISAIVITGNGTSRKIRT